MVLFQLSGLNGQLYLYDDKVIIKKKGKIAKLIQRYFNGGRSFYLTEISSIQVREATTLINGYIQFTLMDGYENKEWIMKSTKNENSLIFSKKNNELVAKIKLKIEEIKQPMQNLIK